MRKTSTIFLQTIIVILGLATIAMMIRFPLTEGRATNLSVFKIYSDPLIMYVYLASIAFFTALYQAFKLLRYIRHNKIFSLDSVKALRNIKYCAITLSASIVIAGIYIRIFHAKEDDPAGFIALCIITTFISIVIATVASVFEKTLQSAVDMKSENDLTV